MTPVRVLLAEDNEDHRFLTVRALSDLEGVELEIETAADGEEALDAISERRPDLVLLDIRMPKVSGLEVLRRLKADPELRSIPTVMLSSSDRSEDITEAYELGTSSYVTKPATAAGMKKGLRQLGEYWGRLVSLPSGAS
ncbi:MAG TPA: response regulator [Acidimicrobiales bacterium]|jgi:two-component system, response regulator|nr:response regulator [Acidimicrobiales bacterium]